MACVGLRQWCSGRPIRSRRSRCQLQHCWPELVDSTVLDDARFDFGHAVVVLVEDARRCFEVEADSANSSAMVGTMPGRTTPRAAVAGAAARSGCRWPWFLPPARRRARGRSQHSHSDVIAATQLAVVA